MRQAVIGSLADRRSHYDQTDWAVVEPYQREVRRDLLGLLPSDVRHILDLGCGNGFITNALPAACFVAGVDISLTALRLLTRPACLAPIIQLPFADGAFDLVMVNDVLEHLPDEEFAAALREIERVAGSYIITTVPFAEDLRAHSLYSAEKDALCHSNEHLRSFHLPELRALYKEFDLDSAVFSGVEWQQEGRSVEAFNTLMGELGASSLAGHPAETVLTSADAAEILQFLRAAQAQALGRAPELIDFCGLRTEIIGIYRRRHAERPKTPIDHAVRAEAVDANAVPVAAIDLSVIDFRYLDRHLHPWLPTMSRFPYVVTSASTTATAEGVRFAPQVGSRSFDLKLGFFCNFEGVNRLELVGSSEGEAILSIAHYGIAHDYRPIATRPVCDAFHISLDQVELSHSQYGILFGVSVAGEGLVLETARLFPSEPSFRSIYVGPIDYLHVAQDGVDCYLNCRYYGHDVPVLEWFKKPGQLPSGSHPAVRDGYRLAAEIAVGLKTAARHGLRFADKTAFQQAVDEAITANAEVQQQQRQITEFGARISSLGEIEERISELKAGVTTLQTVIGRIDEGTFRQIADLGARVAPLGNIDGQIRELKERATALEMAVRRIDENTLSQIDAARPRSIEHIAKLTGELQSARHNYHLRRGRLGALREILNLNRYIATDGGPKPDGPLSGMARLYFSLRGAAQIGPLRWARSQTGSHAVEEFPVDFQTRIDGGQRTVTMLVPDDRVDRRVLLSGRSLSSAGWSVTVVAAPYPGPVDLDQLDFPELRIVRIDTTRAVAPPPDGLAGNRRHSSEWRKVYFYHFNFLAEALQHPAQVYVANDLPVLPAAAVAAAQFGAALVYDAHELFPEIGYYSDEQRAVYTAAEADLVQDAALVTTINQSIAREMAGRYNIAVPEVILNAPAQANRAATHDGMLRRKLQIPPDKRILLYQGAFSLYRNLEDLIAAMPQVKNQAIVLVMMGPDGKRREELEAIARAGDTLGRSVIFQHAVPQSILLSYTEGADVGIVPYPPVDLNSLYCTPNKLFEFIVAGVPILANDLPELRRFVHDTGFGQVHALDGRAAIAQAIDTIFQSDLEVYRDRLAARRHEFTWEVQGRKLVSLYERFGAGRQPGEAPVAMSASSVG